MSLFKTSFTAYLARKAIRRLLPDEPCRDWRPSAIVSVDDDPSTQDFAAMQWVLDVLRDAASLHIHVATAAGQEAVYFNSFPGDHYRLIAALVRQLHATRLVEIGTFTGMATRVMADHAPPGAKVTTYDLLPWNHFQSHLQEADFSSGRVEQRLVDLSNPKNFSRNLDILAPADLIFLDAPKDGHFEPRFLALLSQSLPPSQGPRWLLMDDIRLLPMVMLWRSIASPKLDLTSFAHWSGTGLVDLREGLRFKRG